MQNKLEQLDIKQAQLTAEYYRREANTEKLINDIDFKEYMALQVKIIPAALNLISNKDLLKRISLSNSTLCELRGQADFPKPINISGKRLVWNISELSEWFGVDLEADRLIGLKHISQLTALSISRIYALAMDENSDFPAPIKLNSPHKRRLWKASAIKSWIMHKMEHRRKNG